MLRLVQYMHGILRLLAHGVIVGLISLGWVPFSLFNFTRVVPSIPFVANAHDVEGSSCLDTSHGVFQTKLLLACLWIVSSDHHMYKNSIGKNWLILGIL